VWAVNFVPPNSSFTRDFTTGVVLGAQVLACTVLSVVIVFARMLSDRVLVIALTLLAVVSAIVQTIDNPDPVMGLVQYSIANSLVCASSLYLLSVVTSLISKMFVGRWLALKFAGASYPLWCRCGG
jgi:hypothetical protein